MNKNNILKIAFLAILSTMTSVSAATLLNEEVKISIGSPIIKPIGNKWHSMMEKEMPNQIAEMGHDEALKVEAAVLNDALEGSDSDNELGYNSRALGRLRQKQQQQSGWFGWLTNWYTDTGLVTQDLQKQGFVENARVKKKSSWKGFFGDLANQIIRPITRGVHEACVGYWWGEEEKKKTSKSWDKHILKEAAVDLGFSREAVGLLKTSWIPLAVGAIAAGAAALIGGVGAAGAVLTAAVSFLSWAPALGIGYIFYKAARAVGGGNFFSALIATIVAITVAVFLTRWVYKKLKARKKKLRFISDQKYIEWKQKLRIGDIKKAFSAYANNFLPKKLKAKKRFLKALKKVAAVIAVILICFFAWWGGPAASKYIKSKYKEWRDLQHLNSIDEMENEEIHKKENQEFAAQVDNDIVNIEKFTSELKFKKDAKKKSSPITQKERRKALNALKAEKQWGDKLAPETAKKIDEAINLLNDKTFVVQRAELAETMRRLKIQLPEASDDELTDNELLSSSSPRPTKKQNLTHGYDKDNPLFSTSLESLNDSTSSIKNENEEVNHKDFSVELENTTKHKK
jgi:uncharacterized membrane protein YraQ (UPF0718 family)